MRGAPKRGLQGKEPVLQGAWKGWLQHCAHLHRVEVQVGAVGAGGNAGRGAPAHADSVRGAAYLDDQHAQLRRLLLQVLMVYLAQARTARAHSGQLVLNSQQWQGASSHHCTNPAV